MIKSDSSQYFSLRSFSVIFLSLFFPDILFGQNLLSSKQTSHFSYIYSISDAEAEALYIDGEAGFQDTFLHTLVDSFPVGTEYKGVLPFGHYLKTKAVRNKQEIEITSVQPLRIFSLKNDRDLSIQVFDENGNKIKEASVWAGGKRLNFNQATESYEDKKSNKRGLVKVTHQSFTNYFFLDRQLSNSTFKRSKNDVLYHSPVKYVWVPLRFLIYIPIDGYRSVRGHYATGSIYRISRFFQQTYHRAACLFDSYHCDWDGSIPTIAKGYIVFDKPKYRPLDTLSMKTFLVKRNGKPISKDARLVLYESYGKENFAAELSPLRPGAYTYSLHLHDSLNLKLDKWYRIAIESNKGREWIEDSFYFEEYELERNKLEVSLSSETHKKGEEQILTVSAKDENGLRIKDGNLQVWVFASQPERFLDSVVFLPDTLMYHSAKMAPDKDEKITIPDSIFPKVEMEYHVKALLLNAEFESITASASADFYPEVEPFTFELGQDSLTISYTNPLPDIASVSIYGKDDFGNRELIVSSVLPIKIPLNPLFLRYTAESAFTDQEFEMKEVDSGVKVSTFRNSKDLSIAIQNSRNLPVTYYLYRQNKLIQSGHNPDSPIQLRNKGEKNYYLSLNYIWAGRAHFQNYLMPLSKNSLKISSKEPVLVYPGEEADLDIQVTDWNNKPVEGVDLTAFGLTSKFDFQGPEMPNLAKPTKGKRLINNFTLIQKDTTRFLRPLDYPAWKALASLDTISYYKFVYPDSGLYRYEYIAEDSLTQFSPFLVEKGDFLPISVISVDKIPVYFYWNTVEPPFSFPISAGYRQLKFRLVDEVITLDSVFFEANKRTVLSLDPTKYLGKMKVEPADPEFSKEEKNHFYHYIFPYRNPFSQHFPYLTTDQTTFFLGLGARGSASRTFLSGPVKGPLEFKLTQDFSVSFEHEPYFEYDFSKGLVKMRSVNASSWPSRAFQTIPTFSLWDEVLTEEKIFTLWQSHLEKIRYEKAQYTNPKSTAKGNGRLELGFDPLSTLDSLPINFLIFNRKDLQDIRVYPGSNRIFHELNPGQYDIVMLFKGAYYSRIDSVEIFGDGINYFRVPKGISRKKDEFSNQLVELIEKTVFSLSPVDLASEVGEKQGFQQSYLDNHDYSGPGNFISGFIRDELGEGLPGVTILIRGTALGTITDLDGYYELTVPFGYSNLVVSYIGYSSIEIQPVVGVSNDHQMNPDFSQLSEVVVTAYGVQEKRNLTASMSVVIDRNVPEVTEVSDLLYGSVSGLTVTDGNLPPNTFQIRGLSSLTFQDKPMILVDGKVFLGELSDLDLSQVRKAETLTGEEAIKRFGEKGKNGVVLVYFTDETLPSIPQENSYDFQDGSKGTIRNNFSDRAFWQPSLITDHEGKATFKVKFPDDITAWQTHILAMNGKRQSGQRQGLIKSYLPLSAQLLGPRFLVLGDSAMIIGKSLNYLGDSLEVQTGFEINSQQSGRTWNGILKDIRVDTLMVVPQDSLKLQYQLIAESGFKDGEVRDIPVFRMGMEETKGQFGMMENDTTFTLTVDSTAISSTMALWSDMSGVFEDELEYIHRYRYLCNEQMASKVKALLLQREIDEWKERDFKKEKELKKLITELQKNQRPDGLWGWWKDSEGSIWITQHVVEALKQAALKGYEAGFRNNDLEEILIRQWDEEKDFDPKSRIIQTFLALGSQVGYRMLLEDLEKTEPVDSIQRFHLTLIKSQLGDTVGLEELMKFQRKSVFGNTYYSFGVTESNWKTSDLQVSLLAYQILRRNSNTPDSLLKSIRNYLFEQRKRGNWINTYLSSQVVQTLVPDMIKSSTFVGDQKVELTGPIHATVTQFPFLREINGNQPLEISKTGNQPVYFSFSESHWNSDPVVKKGVFEISTRFDGDNGNVLVAGTPVNLVVDLEVKEDASYVMVTIPIPAGCSYGDKNQRVVGETHREYYLEETAIFFENLPKGKHTLKVLLEPRYSGTYTLNPAKVEMMYFPFINANEAIRKVIIAN